MSLGMGVMINDTDESDPMEKFVGSAIAELSIDPALGDGGALIVTLADGHKFMLTDEGRSCCENRYITCDDDLDHFIGAEVLGAEARDGPGLEDEYDVHEQAFVIFKTSLGEFTITTHNEHNGYYGGFALRIAEVFSP